VFVKTILVRMEMQRSRLTRRQFIGTAGLAGAALAAGQTGCSTVGPSPDDTGELIVRQEAPLNAEPKLSRLMESWITPTRSFYLRSHGTRPAVDPGTFTLRVEGMVERPLSLTLDDLEGLPKSSLAATLQCAGNRRLEHSKVKPVAGVQWDAGAIGTAEWKGVRLADLLQKAGLKPGAKHLWFEGLDTVAMKDRQTAFGGGVPLDKGLRPETILALEMNGRPLTREHGFPVRTIVPGYIGARSVKWLHRIVVSDRPSDNNFVARDYKMFPPEATPETVKPDAFDPIYEMVLGSAICSPAPGARLKAGKVSVSGYAVPPGSPGATVAKVEVSPDAGKSWVEARIRGAQTAFTWCLWDAVVTLPAGDSLLTVRATDSTGRSQPEKAAWNFKGYLNDSWHQVTVSAS
jgi:sulfite oxidase